MIQNKFILVSAVMINPGIWKFNKSPVGKVSRKTKLVLMVTSGPVSVKPARAVPVLVFVVVILIRVVDLFVRHRGVPKIR